MKIAEVKIDSSTKRSDHLHHGSSGIGTDTMYQPNNKWNK